MRVLAVVLSLATLQVAEQRVFVVEAPPSVADAAAVASSPSAATVQLTVRADDVEALEHYLRVHYKRMWLRTLERLERPELEAGTGKCDPDECYSNCYLQGFHGGNCKENKCFCTQVPPHPVNLQPTATT